MIPENVANTAKKVYKYDNRVQATLSPGAKAKIEKMANDTGSSESSIVANAVDFYLKSMGSKNLSNNSY